MPTIVSTSVFIILSLLVVSVHSLLSAPPRAALVGCGFIRRSTLVSTSTATPSPLAQLQPPRRSTSVRMAGDEPATSRTITYLYIGLVTLSVLAAAVATSTGSPPNGLAIVTVSFTVATIAASMTSKSE